MPLIPKWISTAPVNKRKRRRPAPGTPSANVVKSLCTISFYEDRRFAKESEGQNLGWRDPLFRGSKLDDSAFQRGSDGVSPVVSVKLCEDICDVAFHGFLGYAKFAAYLPVRISRCD